MSKSFYYGTTDLELKSKSNTFAALILANPTSYGLVAGQATAYGTLNTAFSNALDLWEASATRTPVALQNKNTAREALVANAKMLAAIIQATPTVTNGQREALGLTVRATPTPVGELTAPGSITATLDTTGALKLAWKATQPRSATAVTYQVWRQIDNTGPWVYLAGTGEKKFTDNTVPAGSICCTYKIKATRSTSTSAWSMFTVNFGVVNDSMAVQSVVVAPKLAA